MKTHPKSVPGKAQSGNNQRRRGVALLTVLTIVSLCTILILTFFQLAQNEMVASDSYNSGLEAQMVAEEAVNLVIRQIRVATSGNTNAWASQPGAIRTWNTQGQFVNGYKLYSDDQMIEPSESALVQADSSDFISWDTEPWRYVDLNEPVVRGDKVYYPIVDPTAREIPNWPQSLGSDDNGIEGFFLYPQDDGKEGLIFNSASVVAPGPMRDALQDVRPSDGVPREPLPMPAMWLYQLKDGSLGYMDSSKNFRPVQGASNPTDDNPIVARFAFWTDDETCKLNPNVHAGGAAWATPMAGGDIDRNLGRFQPAQHEWQRYPGHPASTHIAPVLAPGIPDITYQRDNMELIFGLVPRIVGGGSMSGTRKVNPNDPKENNGLVADKDRLYASLDEFLLEPGLESGRPDIREPNEFPDPGNRFGGSRDAKQMQEHIERSKFFLSVVSRAPEVTLFNTPRVSIWPTHWDGAPFHSDDHHTDFDTLIRFCAEIGSRNADDRYEYHFQRYDSDSAVRDYTGIKRNRDLLDYLVRLTSDPVPGYGKSFQDKYGQIERNQILTEIFDYIRSCNLHDDSLYGKDWTDAFTSANGNTSNHLTYTNGRMNDNNERQIHKGHGQVTPIQLSLGTTQSKGMGRFYTLSEMAVVLIACGDSANNETSGSSHPIAGEARMSNPGMREYQRGFIEDESPAWQYSNIPPIPSVAQRNAPNPASWPQWLLDLRDPNSPPGQVKGLTGLDGEDLLDVAFDERSWNWQLAWIDPGYRAQMPDSKYDRGLVTPASSQAMYLQPGETCVQAGLVWNMFCPSLGWVPINPDMLIDISINGMTFTAADGDADWGGGLVPSGLTNAPSDTAWASNRVQIVHHDRHYGGSKPFTYFGTASTDLINGNFGGAGLPERNMFYESGGIPGVGSNGRITPLDKDFGKVDQFNHYLWMTRPFKIDNRRVEMSAGTVSMNVWAAGTDTVDKTERSAAQDVAQLVQYLEVDFPSFSVQSPILASGRSGYINEFGGLQHGKTGPMDYWSLTRDGANPRSASRGRLSKVNGHHGGMFSDGDVVQSVGVRHGDFRVAAVKSSITRSEDLFLPHEEYGKQRMAHGFAYSTGGRFAGADRTTRDRWLIDSPEMDYHVNRIPFLMAADNSRDVQLYGDFDNGMGNTIDGPYINKPDEGNLHSLFNRTDPGATGLGLWEMARDYGDFPYFVRDWIHEAGTPSYFSPNRIVSSPGQFGSLPVGTTIGEGQPWRTLLFRPNVQGGLYTSHPGSDQNGTEVPDHLFLDLFWMPVVEPFAISEPLSTGGKVNLNYQILPFHHIKRNSAIRGVFKSEYMVCIPNPHTEDYKIGVGRGRGYHWRDNPSGGSLQLKSLRTVILEDHTLYQFEKRFSEDKIFKTASEICDVHLIPQELSKRMNFGGSRASIRTTDFSRVSPEQAVSQMENGEYWSDHAAVGDNSRERPYSNIYARVTTKSNTFKVHYRAQIIKKAKGTDPGQWDPLMDQVVAEYRGSSIVERYVEPNDPDIPDYADSSGGSAPTIDQFYKFRVVNPTRFAP